MDMLNRSQDQLSDGRLSKKGGSALSLIEHDEGFAGGQIRRRKGAMCRKTVAHAPIGGLRGRRRPRACPTTAGGLLHGGAGVLE